MKKSEFKDLLRARISNEEREMLRSSDPELYISDFNRLACLELAFIERKPMHPQKKAGWEEIDGHYYCPSMEKGSIICNYCACEEVR